MYLFASLENFQQKNLNFIFHVWYLRFNRAYFQKKSLICITLPFKVLKIRKLFFIGGSIGYFNFNPFQPKISFKFEFFSKSSIISPLQGNYTHFFQKFLDHNLLIIHKCSEKCVFPSVSFLREISPPFQLLHFL